MRSGTARVGEIAATDAELQAIARLLDLVALRSWPSPIGSRMRAEGRLHLSGRLTADLTQTCVVSLDPVAAKLDVPVEIEFWPAKLLEVAGAEHRGDGSLARLARADRRGRIDPGPVIYEILATSLDPYPKREGASFEWSQPPPQAEAAGAKAGHLRPWPRSSGANGRKT